MYFLLEFRWVSIAIGKKTPPKLELRTQVLVERKIKFLRWRLEMYLDYLGTYPPRENERMSSPEKGLQFV